MKKTISVNLNRQNFNLDLDAYSKLDAYLSEIKSYFENNDSLEVIDDIESRIAEKFNEILGKTKKVIQIEDVKQVIDDMGSVSDITGETENNPIVETQKVKKKLFRDPDSKILTGVAAGYSWYFGIRSIYVRLIFLTLFINPSTSWLAIVTYLSSWLIIPKAKNSWEKLEMKGKPATVSELQTAFEDKTSNLFSNVESKTRNIFQTIISAFVRMFKFFVKLGFRMFGFFTFISVLIAIVCLVFALVLFYFKPSLPYFDLSFIQAIGPPWLEIGYVALGVTLLMPLIFILDLADDLMALKWHTSFQKVLVMLTIWIFSLITFCSVAKINYPKYQVQLDNFVQKIKYLNYIDESKFQILPVGNLKQIDISSVKTVKIIQSDVDEVKIIGNQTQIDELNQSFSNGILTIIGKNEKWFNCHNCSGRVSSVRVEIKAKNISSLKLDNTDAWVYPTSGVLDLNLGHMIGVKVEGNLDSLNLTSNSNTYINLIDANIGQVDAQIFQSTLKTAAKVIKITGDSGSTLIYQGTPTIISGENDNTIKEKYILSQDHEKLIKALEKINISLDGDKKSLKDFNWSSDFETQKDVDFYHIYTYVKPQNTANVYVLWFIEKNGLISLNKSFKITGLEDIHYINLINDKYIHLNGPVYGPELKEETKEIYIDKIKNQLEIYLPKESE